MPENPELISIVTPVYNIEEFLSTTIDSVLNQTYTNWELILVDDCSQDNSREIIERYAKKDQRIRPVLLEKNGGAGHARNVGLDHCKGEFIAFLDSDDSWFEEKLEKQLTFLKEHKEASFVYTWYNNIDDNGQELSHFVTPEKVSFDLLKFNNYILTSSVICRANLLENTRFALMRRRQDWVLFLDLLKKVDYAYAMPSILVNYRKSANSLSSNRFKLIKPNYDFFRSYLYQGNHIKSILHFIVFLPIYFHNKIFNKKPISK